MIRKKVTKIFVACMMTVFLFGSVSMNVHAETPKESMRETEPNNTKETAELIKANNETAQGTVDASFSGRFEVNGDTSETDPDWYKVYLNTGVQYMTCYINPFSFALEDESGNELLTDTYTYADADRFGRTAYEFNVPTAGYYYVKIIGCDASSGRYQFMVGGPSYAVSSCEIPCREGMINMTSSVRTKTAHFDGKESATIPKDAIAYYVQLSGMQSQSVKSVQLTNEKSGLSVSLKTYTWNKDNLESMNMQVASTWTAKLEYNKVTSFTPVLRVQYAYPIYNTAVQ